MSLPFLLLTFLLFLRFSKREWARDRRSSRWQKDSFVSSRPFQLIFIVCLLGQASVASHGTLLFVIVASCPAALRLPPRFVQTSRGNASSVSDRRFSPLYLVDQKLWIRSVRFERRPLRTRRLSNIVQDDFAATSSRVSSSANPFQPREAHLLHLDVCLPRSVYAVRGTRRSS